MSVCERQELHGVVKHMGVGVWVVHIPLTLLDINTDQVLVYHNIPSVMFINVASTRCH